MYEWQSHTGEAQLEIVSDTPEGVLAEAVDAFGRLVERDPAGEPARRQISVEGSELSALLVELLQELIYLADTEGFVPDHAELRLDENRLSAALDGRVTAVDPLVKAATYHGLEFERKGEVWNARVVLDV
jgi:SHS2 domain-containing protein